METAQRPQSVAGLIARRDYLVRTHPRADEQFCSWLCGFVDAEGCFYLPPADSTAIGPRFQITLRIDDWPVLSWLKTVTGLGHILFQQKQAPNTAPHIYWRIAASNECAQFARLLCNVPADDATGSHGYPWAVGLIEGDGCFSLRRSSCYPRSYECGVFVASRIDDLPMLQYARDICGVGHIYLRRRNKNLDNHRRAPQVTWHSFTRRDTQILAEIISDVGLRSKKHREFPLWRKAVGIHGRINDTHAKCAALAEIKQQIHDIRQFDWSFDWEQFYCEQERGADKQLGLFPEARRRAGTPQLQMRLGGDTDNDNGNPATRD